MFQPFIPNIDCADVAINAQNLEIAFNSSRNFEFKMNQALFRQEGDNCSLRIVFVYNAPKDLIILGQPAFLNMNITIDYERGLIGLSGGVDRNPVIIRYGPRIGILIGVFVFLALGALALNFSVDRARKQMKETLASTQS